MSASKANCVVCGKPLVYWSEAREVTCHVCGKVETSNCACEDEHYVCNGCHRAEGVRRTVEYCLVTDSKNPIEITMHMMDDESIYPNGPEHHTLIGASLLAAYKNCGGDIELSKALAEMRKRSLCVPGGACGFWGTCGAACSAGQYWSIVSGPTPLKDVAWGECQRLTSNILARLADYGGPRCCKRTGFTAIEEAVAFTKEKHGIEMEMPEKIVCKYFPRNAECLRMGCPYFPRRAKAGDDVSATDEA